MSEKSDIRPMLSLQKSNDPTVKYVKYHGKINGKISNNMTNTFHRSTCPSTKAVNLFLTREAQSWYSLQIKEQMEKGKKAHEIDVDKRISMMKPLYSKWVVSFNYYMKNHSDIVLDRLRN